MRSFFWLASFLALVGCAEAPTVTGVYLETPGGKEDSARPLSLGYARFKAEVCKDEPLYPEFYRQTEESLVQFLRAHEAEVTVLRVRRDLVYLDVKYKGGQTVRLRVAILNSPEDAGHELHEAILEHGPGSWGVHRANLAVLGPIGSLDQVVTFAAETKLVCWGMLTMAGLDDSFVIPGGYMEL
jgi:hypothetical protein